jgi:hypothetical protein
MLRSVVTSYYVQFLTSMSIFLSGPYMGTPEQSQSYEHGHQITQYLCSSRKGTRESEEYTLLPPPPPPSSHTHTHTHTLTPHTPPLLPSSPLFEIEPDILTDDLKYWFIRFSSRGCTGDRRALAMQMSVPCNLCVRVLATCSCNARLLFFFPDVHTSSFSQRRTGSTKENREKREREPRPVPLSYCPP